MKIKEKKDRVDEKNDVISDELLNKYFEITGEALVKAKKAIREESQEKQAEICIDMAERYFSDAHHFREHGEYTLAFGALNYAHGWLDCGARLGFYKVNDSRLFTVD
ncbi:MAG: DUF357 domain-containing protein [Nanoarchaeota archaeon]|nr:DUF357 domain-containing protein [Nanoarchaeota archaeon]